MDLPFDHEMTTNLWLALFFLILARAWFGKVKTAGLGLCHLLNLAIIHFFTEFFMGTTSGIKLADRHLGILGYQMTGVAISGLITAFIAVQIFIVVFKSRLFPEATMQKLIGPGPAYIAVVYGLVAYFALTRILGFIPSIISLLSSGLALAATGMVLLYFIFLKTYGPLPALGISSLGVLFPVLTVVFGGFMGFGVFAILSLLCFMICNHQPRWQIALLASFTVFIGLSLYPAYMKARDEIRKRVWGDSDYSDRISATIMGISEHWTWFDPSNDEQLTAMNDRLNQNVIVGTSYIYMTSGYEPFANGETLIDGIYALIPRAIWQDKHIRGGSGKMVTRFAGIVVPDSTSIGIGNVMELFVNFGLSGLYFGFFAIGFCVYLADEFCGYALAHNDVITFTLYFIMLQSLMNVIGSFVEWGPSLVGAGLLCYLYFKFSLAVKIEKQF